MNGVRKRATAPPGRNEGVKTGMGFFEWVRLRVEIFARSQKEISLVLQETAELPKLVKPAAEQIETGGFETFVS